MTSSPAGLQKKQDCDFGGNEKFNVTTRAWLVDSAEAEACRTLSRVNLGFEVGLGVSTIASLKQHADSSHDMAENAQSASLPLTHNAVAGQEACRKLGRVKLAFSVRSSCQACLLYGVQV